jgi:hypothetical protein
MSRRGGSRAGLIVVGAALVVALLGGLSTASELRDARERSDVHDATERPARLRIGVYDPRALPRRPAIALAPALAAIARQEELIAITAQADFHSDRVELVDVTGALAAALPHDGR